jgi:hypothetical protein
MGSSLQATGTQREASRTMSRDGGTVGRGGTAVQAASEMMTTVTSHRQTESDRPTTRHSVMANSSTWLDQRAADLHHRPRACDRTGFWCDRWSV